MGPVNPAISGESDPTTAPTPARRAWVAASLGLPEGALRWRLLGAREGPTRLWSCDLRDPSVLRDTRTSPPARSAHFAHTLHRERDTRIPHPSPEGEGSAWIVKEFFGGRGYAQTIRAHRAWQPLAPWLAPLIAPLIAGPAASGTTATTVTTATTATTNTPGALLFEKLVGETIVGDGEVDDHHEAGRFLSRLARLSDLAPHPDRDDDPLPVAQALRQRIAALGPRLAALPCGLRARAAAEQSALASAAEALIASGELPPRRWCHRDFGPWNWLRAPQPRHPRHPRHPHRPHRLTILDLEHARPDLPEVDLVRLACGPWRRRPALRDAFFAGLREAGGADDLLGPAATARLTLLTRLHALNTLAWAARHPHAALAADALALLGW